MCQHKALLINLNLMRLQKANTIIFLLRDGNSRENNLCMMQGVDSGHKIWREHLFRSRGNYMNAIVMQIVCQLIRISSQLYYIESAYNLQSTKLPFLLFSWLVWY